MLRSIGRGAVAAGAGVGRAALATAKFAYNTSMQAAERLIPHGANELGAALYTGSAYAPPGVTERLTPDKGNVHGTGTGQQQVQGNVHGTGGAQQTQPAQAQAPRTAQSAHPSTSHAQHASIYYSPQQSYGDRLSQQASRMASKPQERGRER